MQTVSETNLFFFDGKDNHGDEKKLLSSTGVRDDFLQNYRDGGLGAETEFWS